MPVASSTFRKVELKNDVLISGNKILSLSGDAGIRIWNIANPSTNDTPLLIAGQTITNGVDGVSFGDYPTSMLYVEAIDSGTATLKYSFVGTGDAEGYNCNVSVLFNAADFVNKLPLGHTAEFSNLVVGKVYIPTKWGGTLTLYNCDVDLYYTDGSDLTGETAARIINGQMGESRVAYGSPCEYVVPTNRFKWFREVKGSMGKS